MTIKQNKSSDDYASAAWSLKHVFTVMICVMVSCRNESNLLQIALFMLFSVVGQLPLYTQPTCLLAIHQQYNLVHMHVASDSEQHTDTAHTQIMH